MSALKAVTNTQTEKNSVKGEIKNTAAEKQAVDKAIVATQNREEQKEKARTLSDVARDMDMCRKKVERCNVQIDSFNVKLVELEGRKAAIEAEINDHRQLFRQLKDEWKTHEKTLMGMEL